MVKIWKKDVVAIIWYEPTDEEKDCKCEIRVDVARNMLYTPDFVPEKDSFFYEDVETGSLQSNSDKDETSSKSSSRESEREVESPVVEAEVSPDVENDSDGEDEAINAAEDDNSEPQSDEDENMSERSSSDVESDNDGVDEIESESDSETDTDDDNDVELTPELKIKWKKGVVGDHNPLEYDGHISQESSIETKKKWYG